MQKREQSWELRGLIREDELRVEVGVKESIKKKLLRRTWVGHVEKISEFGQIVVSCIKIIVSVN